MSRYEARMRQRLHTLAAIHQEIDLERVSLSRATVGRDLDRELKAKLHLSVLGRILDDMLTPEFI